MIVVIFDKKNHNQFENEQNLVLAYLIKIAFWVLFRY